MYQIHHKKITNEIYLGNSNKKQKTKKSQHITYFSNS